MSCETGFEFRWRGAGRNQSGTRAKPQRLREHICIHSCILYTLLHICDLVSQSRLLIDLSLSLSRRDPNACSLLCTLCFEPRAFSQFLSDGGTKRSRLHDQDTQLSMSRKHPSSQRRVAAIETYTSSVPKSLRGGSERNATCA